MSKTTIALLILLLLALGGFFYVKYETPHNALIKSLIPPSNAQPTTENTTLSLISSLTLVQRGQTLSVAVTVHNEGVLPSLVQLEIAYDPTVLTATSVLPGTFFTKPTVALQNISSDVGRISYALKCPQSQTNLGMTDCANAGTTTLATLTFLVNPLAAKPKTTITFLPKTLVRSKNGTNILHQVNSLTVDIQRAVVPVASSSGQ